MKETWIYDLEVWKNFHSATFLNPKTDEILQFVIYKDRNDYPEIIEFLTTRVSGLIGFNNVRYDYPILHYLLKNKNYLYEYNSQELTENIYRKSNFIIGQEYQTIKYRDMLIPQLDLYLIHHFDNKNKKTSLKYVESNINFENVEDLPFDPDYEVQDKDVEKILAYNLNDVIATKEFYKLSINDIEMRKLLRREFKFPLEFLNFNDPKIGEVIFAKEISKALGISIWDLREMRTYRDALDLGSIILPYIKFSSSEFNKILQKFKDTIIVDTKDSFNYSVIYKGFKYDYGVGGIHGCIRPGIYTVDDDHIIEDIDIDGMYPSTSILNGFYPQQFGETFCEIYEKMYHTRMQAKRAYKLDKNNNSASAINSGLKLALNGVYGKSNDKFSFLYDPLYTMKVTINGQLLLSMLAERVADIDGLKMLQINTDGLTVLMPKKHHEKFLNICKEWEHETCYSLEHAQYSKMVIRDVNNYIAQYTNGNIKQKGIFEVIPMQNGKPAYNKNWSMRIVPKALEAYFIRDIPIEETIRNSTNIYDFCITQKFPKPWVGEYTEIIENNPVKTTFNKIIRYYISNKGSYLWKVNTEDKRRHQINVGFIIQPFNKFVLKDDYDINYNFYISETRKIITSINDGQTMFDWYN